MTTRLHSFRSDLRERVAKFRSVVRVVGLSGIGKSRLTIEALNDTEEDVGYQSLSDLVLYVAQSEAGPEAIITAVQALADTGSRAIVVVDQCELNTHRILTGIVVRSDSRLSLMTIDDEVPPSPLDDNTIKIDLAPDAVIDGIIETASPELPSAGPRQACALLGGNPTNDDFRLSSVEYVQTPSHSQQMTTLWTLLYWAGILVTKILCSSRPSCCLRSVQSESTTQ